MASMSIKPGIPVSLQELDSSSPLFKQGSSLRVTGKLKEYSVESAIAVIVDGSANLKVDTQHLRDINFTVGSIYQFIGELLIESDDNVLLQARVGRIVDGIDLNLYYQSLELRKQFMANHMTSPAT
ncbi:CST complex subunit TEN1 isoform X2 [Nymphaea colorata]|nr:CST complex subunit TEN1 isoform X2 [Nymphaea colorata]XP_031498161.1 CST complex subunit TEN1 isoform X2 [Nymphaea colorata]